MVAYMKAKNSLVVWCREKKKKTDDGENVFFNALVKNVLLTLKSFSWPTSIKWTSWKGIVLYYCIVLLYYIIILYY